MKMKILTFPSTAGFKGWKQFFSKESVSHPAKINLGLLRHIIETYTELGDVVLDVRRMALGAGRAVKRGGVVVGVRACARSTCPGPAGPPGPQSCAQRAPSRSPSSPAS